MLVGNSNQQHKMHKLIICLDKLNANFQPNQRMEHSYEADCCNELIASTEFGLRQGAGKVAAFTLAGRLQRPARDRRNQKLHAHIRDTYNGCTAHNRACNTEQSKSSCKLVFADTTTAYTRCLLFIELTQQLVAYADWPAVLSTGIDSLLAPFRQT